MGLSVLILALSKDAAHTAKDAAASAVAMASLMMFMPGIDAHDMARYKPAGMVGLGRAMQGSTVGK
jgi:hypothetical protein